MASEEPLFDPTLKKKKKKKVVAFNEDPLAAEMDPTTPAADVNGDADLGPATVHEQMKQNGHVNGESKEKDDDDDIKAMFGDLKKKKKKKDVSLDPVEDGASTPTPAQTDEADATEGLEFSDLKKKKKSTKKKAALDFEKELGEAAKDEEEAEEDGDIEYDEEELGDDPFARGAAEAVGIDTGKEPWLGSDRDYTYQELLHRFYSSLHASNPAMLTSSGKRYTIPPPSIMRDGNKKTIFANIAEICKRMHRQPDHVIQFLFSEMGTTGSVDGSSRLVVKGRFQQKQIENILRRYIVEYVTCKTCKSPDTILSKENRIFFTTCESCGSRRSVNTIKTGFTAQVGRRSKTKN